MNVLITGGGGFIGSHTADRLLDRGDRITIIDNFATARYVERFAGPVETITYAAAHHTLEFEPAGPPFVADVLWWLGRRGL